MVQDDVLANLKAGRHWQTCDEGIQEPVDGWADSVPTLCTSCARCVLRGMLGWLSTAEMLRRF